jgi:mannosyltransferase OCH1-like enzyme
MEKNIHQIWVGPYEMPDIEKEYVSNIKTHNLSFNHILWTNENLPHLPDKLKRIYDKLGEREDYAFQADILRLYVVYEFGGLYLDVDFKFINTFENSSFFENEGVFFFHKSKNETDVDLTSPNGIFGAKKHSPILEFLIENIDENNWWVGPSWLGETLRKYFNLPKTASHEEVEKFFKTQNVLYYPFYELEKKYVRHLALASWQPEGKKQFKKGNINYQKGLK